jgi:hypothetical protein
MLILRSRSSGLRFRFDEWLAYDLRNGSNEDRTTFAFRAVDLLANLAYSASRFRNTLHSSSLLLRTANVLLVVDSGLKIRGTGAALRGDS